MSTLWTGTSWTGLRLRTLVRTNAWVIGAVVPGLSPEELCYTHNHNVCVFQMSDVLSSGRLHAPLP